MKIYPSLISADLLRLKEVITLLDNHCDGYHLDVMDDHFVPNLTWGPMFINAIAADTTLPLQVHLMVTDPATWLSRLDLCDKDSIIFHIEAMETIEQAIELIKDIHDQGIRAGIALNPATEVTRIKGLLPQVDEVLVMSVNPGFSGQAFIDVTNKIDELKDIRLYENLTFEIGMDGGINKNNIPILKQHGVEFVGIASAIFSEIDLVKAVKNLR